MSSNEEKPVTRPGKLLLGIDTCGPAGSVALGRIDGPSLEILGETELEGRGYSATLVSAVADLLARHDLNLSLLDAIVVINGPGSFTGVRVGLSAVKGLAEVTRIPVVAISRLQVLAAKACVPSSALDAHRHEVYLRLAEPEGQVREILAGKRELAAIGDIAVRMAVCDSAAELLGEVWPGVELVLVRPPTASDALRLCTPHVLHGDFVDLALLDGHYLRRSDAEIFGEAAKASKE